MGLGNDLIFATLGPVLEQAVVTEMSAVGGAIIFAIVIGVIAILVGLFLAVFPFVSF